MKDALLRLITLCALCGVTEQMKLGCALGRVCSLCVIETLVETLVSVLSRIL